MPMKNDASFKLVAAIIVAGVLVAFAGPTHAERAPGENKPDAVTPIHLTE